MTTDLMNTVKLKPTPGNRGFGPTSADVADPLTGSFPTPTPVYAPKWTAIKLKPVTTPTATTTTTTTLKSVPKDEKKLTYNILNPGHTGTNTISDKLHMEDGHSNILRNTETSPRSLATPTYGMYNMGTIREEDWTQVSH